MNALLSRHSARPPIVQAKVLQSVLRGNNRISEIARDVGLSNASACLALQRLQTKGLVEFDGVRWSEPAKCLLAEVWR